MAKELVVLIRYIVDVEYFNAEEVMEHLRENGEAEITDVHARDKENK